MTDKQIIIDGTHCRYAHFDGGNTQRLLCAIDDCFCDGLRTNECYYKQLKRKEQECERLKIYIESNEQQVKEVETLVMDNDRLINELDQLKAENDELKGIRDGNFLHALEEQNRADKYFKTLTEIKEIAEKIANYYDGDEYELMRKDAEQILQKISECEGNDEM